MAGELRSIDISHGDDGFSQGPHPLVGGDVKHQSDLVDDSSPEGVGSELWLEGRSERSPVEIVAVFEVARDSQRASATRLSPPSTS